jgi:hypothetical protein
VSSCVDRPSGGLYGSDHLMGIIDHPHPHRWYCENWRLARPLGSRVAKDFELALSLATNHPEIFEVAHEYECDDFQKAIQHVSSPHFSRPVRNAHGVPIPRPRDRS